jgi:hypothetical protein
MNRDSQTTHTTPSLPKAKQLPSIMLPNVGLGLLEEFFLAVDLVVQEG